MPLKLIAADLDGTLLNEAGEVSEFTQKVFLRAQQDGIRVVLATGRDLPHFVRPRLAAAPVSAADGLSQPPVAVHQRHGHAIDLRLYPEIAAGFHPLL